VKFTFHQVIAAFAGIMLADYLSGRALPKWLQITGLTAQPATACACGGGCNSCAKNVTERAQVIDVTPVNSSYVN